MAETTIKAYQPSLASGANEILDVFQNRNRDNDVQRRRRINVKMKLHSPTTALGVVGADIGYIDIRLTQMRSAGKGAKDSPRRLPLCCSDYDRGVLVNRRPVEVSAYPALDALIKDTN